MARHPSSAQERIETIEPIETDSATLSINERSTMLDRTSGYSVAWAHHLSQTAVSSEPEVLPRCDRTPVEPASEWHIRAFGVGVRTYWSLGTSGGYCPSMDAPGALESLEA
ncbi:hypothetical protein RhiJN_10284 [Ceratobasidium sp. AG-Ba]|nr:hypothetical protein RhiJN_10284 [Ceratobasidium sp. AG-Ba]QRW11035.1 hypothetical protein RhiLY_10034 [Ceratobasidium sp. AG-Ba]